MNKRFLTKYAIYSIAILLATLINGLLIEYIKKQITEKGYLLVLIDMLVVVLIFAPAFAIVSTYTKKISSAYIKTTKKVTKSKTSIFIAFVIAIAILFALYAKYRHGINIVQNLTRKASVK